MNNHIKYKEIDGIKVRYNKPSNRKLRHYIPIFKMSDWEAKFDISLFSEIIDIYNKQKSKLGYCDYWHFEKLGLGKVFRCLKGYYKNNPYKIRFNVDRSGLNVYFKLL